MFLPMSSCLAAVANHIFAIHFGPNSIYTYSNWLCVILTQEGMQGNFFEKLTAFASPRLLHCCIECNCAWLYYVHKLYHTLYFFLSVLALSTAVLSSLCVYMSLYVRTYVRMYVRVCERDEPLYQCDEVYCVTLSVTTIQMTNQCYLGCRNIFKGRGARLWLQEIRGERQA